MGPPSHTITKPLTYVIAIIGQGRKRIIKKNLAYAIIVALIDFDPEHPDKKFGEKFGAKQVLVDGKIAIKLKGRIYTEI